jgi:DNA-directed RNA polymerase specialized sigma24 family protein
MTDAASRAPASSRAPRGPSAVSEPEDVLAELPVAYAVALRLYDAGVSTQLIARAVGIEAEAVEPLLRLARAKLAERLEASGPASNQQ